MTELEIGDRRHGTWTVLKLVGDLDTATAARVRDRVAQLAETGAVRVIVELDRLTFLDSSGLDVLVGALRAMRDVGGELRLVATDELWLGLLHRTGLHTVLPPHRSIDQAAATPPPRADRQQRVSRNRRKSGAHPVRRAGAGEHHGPQR